MSNIKQVINQLNEPDKSFGEILIEFYETMKALENDPERGGKQATKIIMTINDLTKVMPATDTIDNEGKTIKLGDKVGYSNDPSIFTVVFENNAFRKKYSHSHKTDLKPILESGNQSDWKVVNSH